MVTITKVIELDRQEIIDFIQDKYGVEFFTCSLSSKGFHGEVEANDY